MTSVVFRQRALDGCLLPIISTRVTIDDVYSDGDLQVNLGLLDGFKDKSCKITVRAVKSDPLRLQERG